MRFSGVLLFLCAGVVCAQEAGSGFDLRTTISAETAWSPELTQSPRDGSPVVAGFRSVLYPTWKIDQHWIVSGAIQVSSRPYFYEDFSTQGYGVSARILQANLGYMLAGKKKSLVVRAGQLSTAFGSFPLRYDDAVNPLIDMPMEYGYYYAPVTIYGIAGIQADATLGKWDGRVQLANSSPANPRSIFDKDQYGNWAGGFGYSVRQGLRVGVSGYRGPWLDREYPYYFPGEAPPRELPATGLGVDVEAARGHWNFEGEWQHFVMAYRAIPTFQHKAGYFEAKRVLTPRWYIAARAGYLHGSYSSGGERYEAAAGFRPNAHQLIKAGYAVEHERAGGDFDKVVAIQLVTSLDVFSLAVK